MILVFTRSIKRASVTSKHEGRQKIEMNTVLYKPTTTRQAVHSPYDQLLVVDWRIHFRFGLSQIEIFSYATTRQYFSLWAWKQNLTQRRNCSNKQLLCRCFISV